MHEPEILTHPHAEALSAAVAGRLVAHLAAAQAAGRVPTIALTGGTVAVTIHEALVTATAGSDPTVDWSRVEVLWGDERFVPAADDDRNAKQAQVLLAHVDVDPARVHEMPASDGPETDVDAAAASYAEVVRRVAPDGLDVLMLGVGPDGHVASLFPGFPQLDVDDREAVGVTDSPKPPPERVSLTLPVLNRAREVWFVVAGEGKSAAVAAALGAHGGPADVHDIPAAGVSGRERTLWFLDEGAASRL
ncbi:MAG: 6-phosphogluconolactonase [Nocardioidaceae bacterium]